MAELLNCPNCGKVFVKAMRSVCDECARAVEEKFDVVYKFIRKRENRRANMDELHEGTGVEKEFIIQFIREGRLHLSQFPNLAFPCEKCGTNIREGRLCEPCRREIQEGLKSSEREKAHDRRKEEKKRVQTYSTLDDKIDRRRR